MKFKAVVSERGLRCLSKGFAPTLEKFGRTVQVLLGHQMKTQSDAVTRQAAHERETQILKQQVQKLIEEQQKALDQAQAAPIYGTMFRPPRLEEMIPHPEEPRPSHPQMFSTERWPDEIHDDRGQDGHRTQSNQRPSPPPRPSPPRQSVPQHDMCSTLTPATKALARWQGTPSLM